MSVELFEAVGSVLAIVAIGIAVRKVGMLTEEADASLLRLIINLLMPCLIFSSIVGNAKVKDPVNTVWAPIAGFVGVALPMLICFVLARYVFKTKVFRDKSARRTFAVSTGLQNYGYVAIPVIDRVFGSELLGIMMLHNMGVELALWSVGIMLLNGHISRESWKKLINGPSIAVVVSLGFNALGIDQYVPQTLFVSISQLGKACVPLGVLLIGATVYDYMGKPEFSREKWIEGISTIILSNIMRSGVIPITILFITSFMPYSVELRQVIVVEVAMPAAFFPIVLARIYKGRPDVALQIAMSSLVIGMLVLPFWIAFGKSILGV